MQILNNFEIARNSYIIELREKNISQLTRETITKEAINHLHFFVNIVDIIFSYLLERISNNEMSIDEAIDFFNAEYSALKLDETYCEGDCYSILLKLILLRKKTNCLSEEVRFNLVKNCYEGIESINVEELRNGLLLFIAKGLFISNIYYIEIEFSINVMEKVKTLSAKQINDAIVPSILLTELWVS